MSSINVRVSSPTDHLIVWQSRTAEPETFSPLYTNVESKVLTAENILSSSLSVKTKQKSFSTVLADATTSIKRICEVAYEALSAAARWMARTVGELPRLISSIQVVSIIALPGNFINLIQNLYLSIYGKGRERIDAGLKCVESLASMISGVALFALGVQGLIAISERVPAWFGTVSLISTIFSSVSVLIGVRSARRMQRLACKLDSAANLTSKVGEAALEDYHAFLKVFGKKMDKKVDILKECFHFDEQQLAQRLIAIEFQAQALLDSSDEKTQQAGRQLLFKTMKTLRGRISHNIGSSILGATAGAVNVVGSVVFLACPIFPVGLVITGVGALISAAKFTHQRVIDYQVMKQFDLERKWHEWLTS